MARVRRGRDRRSRRAPGSARGASPCQVRAPEDPTATKSGPNRTGEPGRGPVRARTAVLRGRLSGQLSVSGPIPARQPGNSRRLAQARPPRRAHFRRASHDRLPGHVSASCPIPAPQPGNSRRVARILRRPPGRGTDRAVVGLVDAGLAAQGRLGPSVCPAGATVAPPTGPGNVPDRESAQALPSTGPGNVPDRESAQALPSTGPGNVPDRESAQALPGGPGQRSSW